MGHWGSKLKLAMAPEHLILTNYINMAPGFPWSVAHICFTLCGHCGVIHFTLVLKVQSHQYDS